VFFKTFSPQFGAANKMVSEASLKQRFLDYASRNAWAVLFVLLITLTDKNRIWYIWQYTFSELLRVWRI
jgi:hypothetical protein